MRTLSGLVSIVSLLASPVAAPALAQQPANRLPPEAERPATRPAPNRPQPPAISRPVPPIATLPSKPNRPPVISRPVPPIATLPPPRPPRPSQPYPPGGNWGPGSQGGNWGPGWNDWNGRIVRCESWNFRYARCNLDTRGGVRLVRRLGGDCRQGSSWGWSDRGNYVWVNRGCRGDFQTRDGNWQGNGGPSAGAVIAGVAVTAGLIALLSSQGRQVDTRSSSSTPANINIAAGAVPAAAETSFRTCLNDAARQVGATGGTSIKLIGAVDAEQGNGGWRFRIPLEGSWPDKTHTAPVFCRATPTQLIELGFHQS